MAPPSFIPKEPVPVRIFLFLHIATMFTAVAVTLGPWLLLRGVGRTRDVPTIRRTFALALPITRFVPILYGLGAALGIVAIFTNGFDPFQPFLLIAYGLFIIATVVGAVVTEPWLKRVAKTAAESPDAAPSPELAIALDDPRIRVIDWFDPLLVLAFVFDMVVKPFG
jgi:hypothetical protein